MKTEFILIAELFSLNNCSAFQFYALLHDGAQSKSVTHSRIVAEDHPSFSVRFTQSSCSPSGFCFKKMFRLRLNPPASPQVSERAALLSPWNVEAFVWKFKSTVKRSAALLPPAPLLSSFLLFFERHSDFVPCACSAVIYWGV